MTSLIASSIQTSRGTVRGQPKKITEKMIGQALALVSKERMPSPRVIIRILSTFVRRVLAIQMGGVSSNALIQN
jgi:hypothetical protein